MSHATLYRQGQPNHVDRKLDIKGLFNRGGCPTQQHDRSPCQRTTTVYRCKYKTCITIIISTWLSPVCISMFDHCYEYRVQLMHFQFIWFLPILTYQRHRYAIRIMALFPNIARRTRSQFTKKNDHFLCIILFTDRRSLCDEATLPRKQRGARDG